MRNPIAFLFIGLFFGTGIGFIWAGSLGVTFDGHDHAEHAAMEGEMDHSQMDHGGIDHSPVNVPAGPNAPTLAMVLHKDTMSGINLEIQTTNFHLLARDREPSQHRRRGSRPRLRQRQKALPRLRQLVPHHGSARWRKHDHG